MLSGDLENYLDYFESWANEEPGSKFFLYGGVEFGIAFATGREDFGYPFVWLEQPEIVTEDNGAGQYLEKYATAVCFVQSAPRDDLAAQKQASIDMFRLAAKLQKKLLKDNKKASFLDLTIEMKKNEIDKGWAGDHCGWRLEFIVSLNANPYLV